MQKETIEKKEKMITWTDVFAFLSEKKIQMSQTQHSSQVTPEEIEGLIQKLR